MKRICLILCTSSALLGSVQGQSLGAIFSQKSSDLKSVAKQIASLQVYIGWIEKGYQIAKEGLTTIGEIKNGEFSLHSVFFSSLSGVNPAIRKYSKVGIIIADQLFIAQHLKKVLSIPHLNASETAFVLSIYSNMIGACTNSLNELIALISEGGYQLHDDERIKRIDEIYAGMEAKTGLARRLTSEVSMLSKERAFEENNIRLLQNLK